MCYFHHRVHSNCGYDAALTMITKVDSKEASKGMGRIRHPPLYESTEFNLRLYDSELCKTGGHATNSCFVWYLYLFAVSSLP